MRTLLGSLVVSLMALGLVALPARADWADDDDNDDNDTVADDDSADDDATDDDDNDATADDDDDDDATADDDDDGPTGCAHLATPTVPITAIPVLITGLATLLLLGWRRDG